MIQQGFLLCFAGEALLYNPPFTEMQSVGWQDKPFPWGLLGYYGIPPPPLPMGPRWYLGSLLLSSQ